MVSSGASPTRNRIDWKGELKRKLDQRNEKSEEESVQAEKESTPALEPEKEEVETPPTLFKYKLDRALRNSTVPNIQTSSTPKKEHVFEEPLIRRKPVRPVPRPPGQKTLHLRPDPLPSKKKEERPEEEILSDEEDKVPKEVLFSRFLAGIVDLVLPLLMGLTFTLVASFLLGFDLFSPATLKWIGLLALSFFFFNSIFFFLTSGQTPGMVVTDLHLVADQEERELTVGAILLRVALFLPSAATVIGLGWALFDPLCRCLHDLGSRTRVEPAD
jgi:uncharacterized RDD family membrane protein YckC